MGSLGAGEMVVIAVIALVVFGPQRLPELARKAAELLAKAREATRSLTDALDSEYEGVAAPIKDLKAEYDETMRSIKEIIPATPNLSLKPSGGKPKAARSDTAKDVEQSETDAPARATDAEHPTPDATPATDDETS